MVETLLLSGGVDSAAILYKHYDRLTSAVFVDYGQPSAPSEQRAVTALLDRRPLRLHSVKVVGVPLGDMALGVAARIVPARNAWLISLAAAFGDVVWIGCAPQDHRDYPDCRADFLHAMGSVLSFLGKRVAWVGDSRSERLRVLGDDAALCWSCYSAVRCGECPSCKQ